MARPKKSTVANHTAVPAAAMGLEPLSFSLKQAAAVTGIALWHIRSAIWGGHVTAHMAGKKQIILRADLERWIASQPVIHQRTRKAAA